MRKTLKWKLILIILTIVFNLNYLWVQPDGEIKQETKKKPKLLIKEIIWDKEAWLKVNW